VSRFLPPWFCPLPWYPRFLYIRVTVSIFVMNFPFFLTFLPTFHGSALSLFPFFLPRVSVIETRRNYEAPRIGPSEPIFCPEPVENQGLFFPPFFTTFLRRCRSPFAKRCFPIGPWGAFFALLIASEAGSFSSSCPPPVTRSLFQERCFQGKGTTGRFLDFKKFFLNSAASPPDEGSFFSSPPPDHTFFFEK